MPSREMRRSRPSTALNGPAGRLLREGRSSAKCSSVGFLYGRISGGAEVVPALLRLKEIADVADGSPEVVKGSGSGFAQVCLELGKGLLDWIEIRRIGGQEQEPRPVLPQAFRRPFTLVDGQIVEDDYVTLGQRRHELRLNIGIKCRPGDRTIDDPGCAQLMAA